MGPLANNLTLAHSGLQNLYFLAGGEAAQSLNSSAGPLHRLLLTHAVQPVGQVVEAPRTTTGLDIPAPLGHGDFSFQSKTQFGTREGHSELTVPGGQQPLTAGTQDSGAETVNTSGEIEHAD